MIYEQPRNKTKSQLCNDLLQCVNVILDNVHLYESGRRHCYRPVAGQLRLLLCDTKKRRDNSLLLKLFPDAKFHPLSQADLPDAVKKGKGELIVAIPGTLGTGICHIEEICDQSAVPIALDDWLNQWVLHTSVTVRELIRSVTDKDGGAHNDDSLNDVLAWTYSGRINDEPMHTQMIVGIGKYVATQILEWLYGQPCLKKYRNPGDTSIK